MQQATARPAGKQGALATVDAGHLRGGPGLSPGTLAGFAPCACWITPSCPALCTSRATSSCKAKCAPHGAPSPCTVRFLGHVFLPSSLHIWGGSRSWRCMCKSSCSWRRSPQKLTAFPNHGQQTGGQGGHCHSIGGYCPSFWRPHCAADRGLLTRRPVVGNHWRTEARCMRRRRR